ncbi:MAG TPA: prepilin-type N-terminal cleavage/methylation domain-containing protein [Polyangiaceae bacterium]|jgi:type IV pilus assembly protein PilA|nr:prepilin-type N-terminal cleavage/methylation domain-containing protein [Polyangiaceae bacterium]
MPTVRPSLLRERGFTLIEMMVVVMLVGVLAFVAGVAYRRWIRNSRINEAQAMLQNFRVAEESYRSENTVYLATASSLASTALYPTTSPNGMQKVAWGSNPGNWAALNIQPGGPVYFGYAIIAGTGAVAAPEVTIDGKAAGFAKLVGQPWYVAMATCDIDDDTTTPNTTIYASSGSNALLMANEGN